MVSGGIIGGYLNSNGAVIEASNWGITDYIPCNGTTFTLNPIGGNAPSICLYDSNKQIIATKSYNSGSATTKILVTITSTTTAEYVRFSYYISDTGGDDLSQIMLVEGSTVPSEYHPYYEWVEQ